MSGRSKPRPQLLVLGAGGQIGRALLLRAAATGVPAFGLARRELDVLERRRVAPTLARVDAPIVVNAAAYTSVDRAEQEPAAAFQVNRDAAGWIAEACAAQGRTLIHLSTDYVFAGTSSMPYGTDDPIAPLNVYGASKAAGEALVLAAAPQHMVLRTAWIHAPWGSNFVRAVVERIRGGKPLRVIDDQHGSPTAADEVARAILLLAARLPDPALGGVHHWASGVATWFEVARVVADTLRAASGAQVPLERIGTTDWPTLARRPAFSALASDRLAKLIGATPADWRDGVVDSVHGLIENRHARRPRLAS